MPELREHAPPFGLNRLHDLFPALDLPVGIDAGCAIPASGSFHFMQASELETPSFEDSAEWVERADALGHEEEEVAPGPDIAEAVIEEAANGHSDLEETVTADIPTEGEVGLGFFE